MKSMEEAVQALNQLDSAEAVAEMLRQSECKGRIGEQRNCPLYWHLRRVTGRTDHEVTNTAVNGEDDSFLLSWSCEMFISNFDNGAYPELIRNPDE